MVSTFQGLMGIVSRLGRQRRQLRRGYLTQQFSCCKGGSQQPLSPICTLLSKPWLQCHNSYPSISDMFSHVGLSLSRHVSHYNFLLYPMFILCVGSTEFIPCTITAGMIPSLHCTCAYGFGECWCYTSLEDFTKKLHSPKCSLCRYGWALMMTSTL